MRPALPLLLVLACSPASELRPAAPGERVGSADATRAKRGVAYHFCGMAGARGEADLRAMQDDLGWTYNWSERPHACGDGPSVEGALSAAGVEFVPMVWGLVDGGRHCESGGPCFRVDNPGGPAACDAVCGDIFAEGEMGGPGDACWECMHQPISRDDFIARVPDGARWLLGFNEPNFQGQSALTPEQAARGWEHLEHVAEARNLGLVGPATNFCATDPEAPPAARCIAPERGVDMVHLAWLEAFYDACSAEGA
ncbi:MAG: glycosyl hydrolase, partial [Myxococcota bacterium]